MILTFWCKCPDIYWYNPLDMYGLLVSILLCTKLVKDVKQTGYSRLWRGYRAKNSSEAVISLLDVEQINMIEWQVHAGLLLFWQLPKVGI